MLAAFGIGLAAGIALGWTAHKKFVRGAISASRKIRRRALGGGRRR